MRSAILATILGAAALVHAKSQPNWGFKAVTTEEKKAFVIQNRMRTHPKQMAKAFKKALTFFDGKLFKVPGKIPLRTNEGAPAVREAIKFLEKMTPRKPLKWSPALYLASRAHCLDQQKNGGMGHTGSNGSSPGDRIRRFGSTNATGENISYGSSTGFSIISQLFVDDGVPSRGHRKNIVGQQFQATGISICSLPNYYKTGAVLTYSGAIENRRNTIALLKSQKLPKAAGKKKAGKKGAGKKKTGRKPKRKLRRGCQRRLRGCAAARRRRLEARRRAEAARKNQSPAMRAYQDERRRQYMARRRNYFSLYRKCRKDPACKKATRGRRCPVYAFRYYGAQCKKNPKCSKEKSAKRAANAKKLRALYMKIPKAELAKHNERRRASCRARRLARQRRMRARALARQKARDARKNKRRGCRFRRDVQRRTRRRSCRCRRIAAMRRCAARRKAAAAKRRAIAAKKDKLITNQAKAIARLQKQLAAVKSGKPSIIVPRKAYNQVQADIAALKKKVDSVDVPKAALPKKGDSASKSKGTVAAASKAPWIKVGSEHHRVECHGTIRYGARGKFATRKANGYIYCNNGTFGDPIGGVVKSCYCREE